MPVAPSVGRIVLTGYVLAFIILNLVAFLISSFYQKKFGQSSPRAGFIAAIICAALYAAALFIAAGRSPAAVALKVLCLFAGAIASTWSSTTLYFTMKRVRK